MAAPAFIPSPHWTLFVQDDYLIVSGGADETYVVDEAATPAARTALLQAWAAGRVPQDLPDTHPTAAAIRQLRRLGALVPEAAMPAEPTWALAWLDTPDPALAQALRAPGSDLRWTDTPEQAQAVVVIRRASRWQDALAAYGRLNLHQPHLVLDLAYHHTLCLGPYVVPGETACLACLGGRVMHRWGDVPAPAQPMAAAHTELAAALLRQRLQQGQSVAGAPAHAGWLTLLEATVSLNLDTLATDRARVFRLPWCAVCGEAAGRAATGRLDLPWDCSD